MQFEKIQTFPYQKCILKCRFQNIANLLLTDAACLCYHERFGHTKCTLNVINTTPVFSNLHVNDTAKSNLSFRL